MLTVLLLLFLLSIAVMNLFHTDHVDVEGSEEKIVDDMEDAAVMAEYFFFGNVTPRYFVGGGSKWDVI